MPTVAWPARGIVNSRRPYPEAHDGDGGGRRGGALDHEGGVAGQEVVGGRARVVADGGEDRGRRAQQGVEGRHAVGGGGGGHAVAQEEARVRRLVVGGVLPGDGLAVLAVVH